MAKNIIVVLVVWVVLLIVNVLFFSNPPENDSSLFLLIALLGGDVFAFIVGFIAIIRSISHTSSPTRTESAKAEDSVRKTWMLVAAIILVIGLGLAWAEIATTFTTGMSWLNIFVICLAALIFAVMRRRLIASSSTPSGFPTWKLAEVLIIWILIAVFLFVVPTGSSSDLNQVLGNFLAFCTFIVMAVVAAVFGLFSLIRAWARHEP